MMKSTYEFTSEVIGEAIDELRKVAAALEGFRDGTFDGSPDDLARMGMDLDSMAFHVVRISQRYNGAKVEA